MEVESGFGEQLIQALEQKSWNSFLNVPAPLLSPFPLPLPLPSYTTENMEVFLADSGPPAFLASTYSKKYVQFSNPVHTYRERMKQNFPKVYLPSVDEIHSDIFLSSLISPSIF